jgi:hypothetical protein
VHRGHASFRQQERMPIAACVVAVAFYKAMRLSIAAL